MLLTYVVSFGANISRRLVANDVWLIEYINKYCDVLSFPSDHTVFSRLVFAFHFIKRSQV